jgi:hypothetical protein
MPNSYRIRTQVGVDKYINVNLDQDFEFLEILSLKIQTADLYTRFCSDYGVVVGRVIVNGGFGVPNARVSVFLPLEEGDELNPIINELYPYRNLSDRNLEGYRYNLLPSAPSYSKHSNTGTFPTREDVLLNQSWIEVYDKYYRFTVKTNESGDFMIFGVPTGDQTLVMDVDLSDIGCFSLNPQDLIIQGVATAEQVNGSQFKSSTNLDELPQIQNLNFNVDVRPLWGDEDQCQIGITRVDFDLTKLANIKIQPSSIFMGSIMSTTDDDSVGASFAPFNSVSGLFFTSDCKPKNNTGNLCDLVAGPGQILALRQTIFADPNGYPQLEPFSFIDDGKVIDDNGAFVVNVPMNLDLVTTDEFGNQVISNDPNIGIPTKGKYRFKFKWVNEQGLSNSTMRANYLVPNIKEHGWNSSATDPFNNFQPTTVNIQIAAGQTSGQYILSQNGGITNITTINIESYSILINGNPYFGTLNSIPVSSSDVITFDIVPTDSSQQTEINFVFYILPLFNLIRSYAFSLDWDDYGDTNMILEAINCEDKFYEFDYNKVYTTAMFVDRYKKGLGRAKHLGIKEIDDRTCKTTTNTYPVNDIIRNFDFLFFAFNILLNILTPVFIFVLFTAHVAFWIIEKINEDSPLLIRFSLPMINYPECTACDCSCNSEGLPYIVTDGSGIFEPINASENYSNTSITPYFGSIYRNSVNSVNPPDNMAFGQYYCGDNISGQPYIASIQALNLNGVISDEIETRTTKDFFKMFSGYDYELSETDGISLLNPSFTLLGDILLKRAPQTFLWSALQKGGQDARYWAFPNSVPLPQKLNEFNLRDKYFSSTANNRITTTVNPSLGSDSFQDQLLVMLAKPGTLQSMGIGQVITFQNPNLSGSQTLLTGGTFNQFNTNAVTGTTTLGQQTKVIYYADPTNFGGNVGLPADIEIIQSSKYGNTTATQEDDYLRYPTDLEYFQVITGLTYGDFSAVADFTTNGFPKDYLGHKLTYVRPNCLTFSVGNNSTNFTYQTVTLPESSIDYLAQNADYEIIFLTRGVDPHTDKQTIRYDLSLLFGNPASTNIIEGSYYLNYPIQSYPQSPNKPRTHLVSNNTNGLYFQSFTFNITPSNYTAFTSTMPYYYLCTDEYGTLVPNTPNFSAPNVSSLSNGNLYLNNNSYTLPAGSTSYIGGGSFISSTNNTNFETLQETDITGVNNQVNQYYGNPSSSNNYFYKTFLLYSFAYIGIHNNFVAAGNQGPIANQVDFSNPDGILMRSDRLPTSTIIENPFNNNNTVSTAFALHQNTSFTFYRLEANATVTNITLSGFDVLNYPEDENNVISGLTQTLDCEGMVSLQCYTGSGQNIGVNPNCVVPEDRVTNGCYCLLNPNSSGEYLVDGAFKADLQLLLEWKTRFTLTFAACRGVFAQTFQNNWVNGNLYMFSFLKKTSFDLAGNASYRYCKDVTVFNPFSNSFFYRSSPYNDTSGLFIGKNKPNETVGGFNYGYNDKNIQFPTTITDLGPRDSFIKEICCNENFGSYYVDQVKSTSYQDNSDIIQIGFLSRILDNTTLSSMLPGNDQEGLGVNQFFDNDRGGDRIDGDWAQMLSINSEWKIVPFNTDTVDSPLQVFIGKSLPSNSNSKPVFGVFFNRTEDSLRYRKIMSPGIETYSFSPVLVEENFGYPNSQVVPFYKWKVEQPASVIFGTEDNNWWTTPNQVANTGFYTKKYQSLDFETPNEKYRSATTKLGYITNYNQNGVPSASSLNVVDGEPGGNPVLVGAPYHFYFGLYNGKTALDIFYKRYVQVQD